ncbi:hypothetical protein [Salirhabdus salicampi]|uniref:hypothetical protein n=1 Tax=Salirhabdus salicampi TaxID=476102 RepID=UPI0020C26FC1|nr:hypothetical protein [Salirhabdus salicampi]MCP8616224.1 hypothetical protein [Salirhabdus salicampi]
MENVLFREFEEECKHCHGKGYTEVYSEKFWEEVEHLDLLYPTYEQAFIIALDKYPEEVDQEICTQCNGNTVMPNQYGQAIIQNKDFIIEFLQKYKLI